MLLSRRHVLAGVSSVAAAPFALASTVLPKSGRICFFTDAHVPAPAPGDANPENTTRHWARVRKAFDKANSYRPNLFVFGGDNVMAVDQGQTEEHGRAMFDNWATIVKEKVKAPHVSVIGNHDICYLKGVEMTDRKALAKQSFQMPNRYYHREAAGWNFMLLDIFIPGAGTGIDKEQFDWLDAELGKTNRPVCLVSHAPFFGPSCQLDGDPVGGKKELRKLFQKHENVRLALSGHQHWLDKCELDRVSYLCGGAVSGAWWGGEYEGFPPAFLILDLNADGTFRSETVFWETKPGEKAIQ
jgi:3',5'-cyclic AMP phosphodiesterase CpdA